MTAGKLQNFEIATSAFNLSTYSQQFSLYSYFDINLHAAPSAAIANLRSLVNHFTVWFIQYHHNTTTEAAVVPIKNPQKIYQYYSTIRPSSNMHVQQLLEKYTETARKPPCWFGIHSNAGACLSHLWTWHTNQQCRISYRLVHMQHQD